MNKLQNFTVFSYVSVWVCMLVSQCTRWLRICLHQRFLLVTFNSHTHTYTSIRTHTYTQQPKCRRRLWRHFLFHLFLYQPNAKDTFSFYNMPGVFYRLIAALFSFSFVSFSLFYRLSLLLLLLLLPWSKPKQRFLRQVPHRRSMYVCVCVFSPLPLSMDIVVVSVARAEWMDGCPHLYLIEQCAYFFTVLWP